MSMTDYLTAAMTKAVYTALPDGSYEGYVPIMSGTKARGKTRGEYEQPLQEHAQEWPRRAFTTHQ